jgi:hypothetical protein
MLINNGGKKRAGRRAITLCCLLLAGIAQRAVAWKEPAKLTVSDGKAYDYFGHSVSNSGEFVIVGAPYSDDGGNNAGSVYIFRQSEAGWVQQTELRASDAAADDRFGYSVCISGDWVIVGDPYNDGNDIDTGSVYIFRRTDTEWVQQSKLTASDGAGDDLFGKSVSISGNYAIVGAQQHSSDNEEDCGAAYIFKWDGESWIQEAKLTALDAGAYDQFGCSVSISGQSAIVGALYGNKDGNDCGCAYIFKRDSASWIQHAKLVAPDGTVGDKFGSCVSICGGLAIVGAVGNDCYLQIDSGSAYVFSEDKTGWLQQAKLVASDRDDFDEFGVSVSIAGGYAVVGAHYDDDRGGQSGSVYIFKIGETSWFEQAKLTAPDGSSYDRFGASVSIAGNYVVVGAAYNDDLGNNCGSAYIFEKVCQQGDLNGDCWTDFRDFALFAQLWLRGGCEAAYWCEGSDLDHSSYVDWADFAGFAQQWQLTDCVEPGWCGGADTNYSGTVDWADLSVIAGRWLDSGCCRGWCDGADLNQSGEVDWHDMSIFTEHWLGLGE